MDPGDLRRGALQEAPPLALPRGGRDLRLPPGHRVVPVRHVDEVWTGLRNAAHPDDPKGFERNLRAMGRFIAEDNLSTVFRVILAFVGSPEQMVRSLPRLWGQYFEGVEVELDDSGLPEKRGNTVVRNLGDLHHVAPVACGWIDYGLTKVGAKRVQVWEERYREGATAADPLRFRLSWE